jgi:hypothetical protein
MGGAVHSSEDHNFEEVYWYMTLWLLMFQGSLLSTQTLKMETASSFVTMVIIYQMTWCHSPVDVNSHQTVVRIPNLTMTSYDKVM